MQKFCTPHERDSAKSLREITFGRKKGRGMEYYIEELTEPVVIKDDFSTVTLTHRAYGFTFQSWNVPPLTSYSVLGIVKDGKFKMYGGTEEVYPIDGEDFSALIAADDRGKPYGSFNIRDVIEAHIRVKARLAALQKNEPPREP